MVPLKMLPFDNKNEILFLLDMEEGTTLERTDAVVRRIESVLASHRGDQLREHGWGLGANRFQRNGSALLLAKSAVSSRGASQFCRQEESGSAKSGIGLRLRDELETLAKSENAKIQIVELPPGPPVLASLVAEVYGSDKSDYQDVLKSAATVADRMRREPGCC